MDDEDWESPYESMGNEFDTGDTFHVNDDGKPDFAVVEKMGYINEATAAPDGFSPEQPSYWSYKVRFQPSEEYDHAETEEMAREDISQPELLEMIDAGVFEPVGEQSSLDDF